jgi:hypothetical protein
MPAVEAQLHLHLDDLGGREDDVPCPPKKKTGFSPSTCTIENLPYRGRLIREAGLDIPA